MFLSDVGARRGFARCVIDPAIPTPASASAAMAGRTPPPKAKAKKATPAEAGTSSVNATSADSLRPSCVKGVDMAL